MLLDIIYIVFLATLGVLIPRHISGNAVDFRPGFDSARAKRTGIIDFKLKRANIVKPLQQKTQNSYSIFL